MNPRDIQIAAVKERASRLEAIPGRLDACYAEVLRAYEEQSDVQDLAVVVPETERTPSDFRVLTNSEARRLSEFNDPSYYCDQYCRELGRSVALAEQKYIFEELGKVQPSGEIVAAKPDFSPLLNEIDDLVSTGYTPNVMCAPIGLFVPFGQDKSLRATWDDAGEYLEMPGRPKLRIIWSNRVAPLNQFVIFNSRAATWRVKLDVGKRLTVAIGEPDSPAEAVMFLAETVAKYEIANPAAFRAVRLLGEPLDPEEYVNREMLR